MAKRRLRLSIDLLLVALLVLIAWIVLFGGSRGEIFGVGVSATTPYGPIKFFLVLLLLRTLISIRLSEATLLLCSLVIGLVFAEVVLRIWNPPMAKFQLTQIHRPSPEAQWEMIPGASSVANTGATYTINSHGCRDAEYPLDKPAGSYRILALGDSFTFGMGVEQEKTYPAQLERILNEGNHTVEVINCAVTGYDMWQHNVALQKKARTYRPDLVTLGVFVNDLLYSLAPLEISQPGYQGENPFTRKGVRSWLHRIYIYNVMRNLEDRLKYRFRSRFDAKYLQGIAARRLIWGPENPDDIHYRLMAGKAERRFYLAFRRALSEFVITATDSGANVLILMIPDSVQLHDASMQSLNSFVKKTAGSLNVSFLDLTPVLETQDDPESLYLFPDDAHNSPKGLRVIAEAIANELEKTKLLPSATP